jgi:hypothetical protein
MLPTSTTVDLATLVARNARALRGPKNHDDVARAARRFGADWSRGRVSDLERGKVALTLPTLITLALALGEVRGENLTLADMVRSDEDVVLTDDLVVTDSELQGFLSGGAVGIDEERLMAEAIEAIKRGRKLQRDWPARLNNTTHGVLVEVSRDYGEAEQLLARDLGVDRDRLIAEMAARWGRAYHVERDERAGPGVTKQKRGRISRELKAELRKVLDGDD